jgi:hypothetical protein
LRCYYVWLPVLRADVHEAAAKNAGKMENPRASHYWDEGLRLAHHMASALGVAEANAPDGTQTRRIAWDVYLLYQRDATTIERPAFWMHQLDTNLAPRLDTAVLFERVRALLR